MSDFYSIKWIDDNTAERKTREVSILARYKNHKFILKATGDLDHHILEDSCILINKMAEKICGDKVCVS